MGTIKVKTYNKEQVEKEHNSTFKPLEKNDIDWCIFHFTYFVEKNGAVLKCIGELDANNVAVFRILGTQKAFKMELGQSAMSIRGRRPKSKFQE
jgi:hypothetical protein